MYQRLGNSSRVAPSLLEHPTQGLGNLVVCEEDEDGEEEL